MKKANLIFHHLKILNIFFIVSTTFKILLVKHLIKVKLSLVTDNYIASKEIQNQNWQYFIHCIIEACKSKEVGSSVKPTENFLLTTVENVTLAKKILQNVLECH